MSKEKKMVKKVREQLAVRLATAEPGSNEYNAVLYQYNKLVELTKQEDKLTKDQLVAALTTIVTTLMLLGYERNNPITTKLLSFIPKPKIK